MTGRVMLALEDGEALDGEWWGDLLAWDLSYLTGPRLHARCVALVAMVASRHLDVTRTGVTGWPTLPQLASWLGMYGTSHDSEVVGLLAIAVAGGWLVYLDDGAGQ